MSIAYFVQDAADPAVRRRVRMMTLGGSNVAVIGFRRQDAPQDRIDDAPVLDLGRTYDTELRRRALKVLGTLLQLPRLARAARTAQVLIARNLEMLLLAQGVRILLGGRRRLHYEVLDVHSVMLGAGVQSRAMRTLERLLLLGVDQIITSSPAFEREYFRTILKTSKPCLLVENKILTAQDAPSEPDQRGPALRAPPWRIAWFGKIRCQKSLDILDALTRERPGLIEVDIRGLPSRVLFRDFDAQVDANPAIRFLGPYRFEDLPDAYAQCHFVWGLDFYEEGANSAWLLPNRLYEGGASRLPIIALHDVETGRWLAQRRAGALIPAAPAGLEALLANMTPARYEELEQAARAVSLSDLYCTPSQCRRFVEALGA